MRKNPLMTIAAITILVCASFLIWDFQHSRSRGVLNPIGTAQAR